MARTDRKSGAAIATNCQAAISVAAIATVAALATISASSVAAVAARSYNDYFGATDIYAALFLHEDISAMAADRFRFRRVAAIAAIAAIASSTAIATDRHAPVTACRCPAIPYVQKVDVVTGTERNSVSAIVAKSENVGIAAISRPAVATIAAVAARSASSVATFAARSGIDGITASAALRG
jgi:hypothetical protein